MIELEGRVHVEPIWNDIKNVPAMMRRRVRVGTNLLVKHVVWAETLLGSCVTLMANPCPTILGEFQQETGGCSIPRQIQTR